MTVFKWVTLMTEILHSTADFSTLLLLYFAVLLQNYCSKCNILDINNCSTRKYCKNAALKICITAVNFPATQRNFFCKGNIANNIF